MSKSEKNFKKIKEITVNYNQNSIRLFFVTHSWCDVLEFSEDGLDEAKNKDKKVHEFFRNLKIWLRENDLKKDLKFNENDIVNFNYERNCSKL